MAAMPVLPFAKSLYLCEGTIGFAHQKTDLIGIFNSIRAPSYPHLQRHFVAFAQLIGGLGQVPFYSTSDLRRRVNSFIRRTRTYCNSLDVSKSCSWPTRFKDVPLLTPAFIW